MSGSHHRLPGFVRRSYLHRDNSPTLDHSEEEEEEEKEEHDKDHDDHDTHDDDSNIVEDPNDENDNHNNTAAEDETTDIHERDLNHHQTVIEEGAGNDHHVDDNPNYSKDYEEKNRRSRWTWTTSETSSSRQRQQRYPSAKSASASVSTSRQSAISLPSPPSPLPLPLPPKPLQQDESENSESETDQNNDHHNDYPRSNIHNSNIHKRSPDHHDNLGSDSDPDNSSNQEIKGKTKNTPPMLTYREVQLHKCLNAEVVSLSELRKLSWNGIVLRPYRAHIWQLLLGYVPTNRVRRHATIQRKRAEYRTLAAQHYDDVPDEARTNIEQDVLRQVLVDVPRTAPHLPLFRQARIQQLLSRLLYTWAVRHPASSYVQGINDVATPLIVVFLTPYYYSQNNNHHDSSQCNNNTIHNYNQSSSLSSSSSLPTFGQPPQPQPQPQPLLPPDVAWMNDPDQSHGVIHQLSDATLANLEADVYWCLSSLLAGIQDHYTPDQPGVQRMVRRLEELMHRIDVALCAHLRSEGVEFVHFAYKWMNCLLLREFHVLYCIPRLWDTYLSEEKKSGFEEFHVYVCAALLGQWSAHLQTLSFDALMTLFQDMPTCAWTDATDIEMLLSQAYVLSTLFGGSDAHLANTSLHNHNNFNETPN